MGIIDVLTAGFTTIARRVWLIVIPVVLDLFIWLGPKISIARLVRRLEPFLTPQATMNLSKSDAHTLAMSRDALLEMGEHFNLFSLLSNTFLGVPNMMVIGPTDGLSNQASLGEVANGWVGLGLVVLFVLISVVLACIYLDLVAQVVKNKSVSFNTMPKRVLSIAGQIVALGVIILLIMLVLILPVSIFLTLIAFISQGLAMMLLGLLSMMVFWGSILVMIYLFYAIDAMFINESGLFQSVWNSMVMVRRNLWPTLGLILLTNVISAGLMLIWQRLTFAPWGTIIAILGNAFVGSGLVAAIMIFYKDRYEKWQEELGKVPQALSEHS